MLFHDNLVFRVMLKVSATDWLYVGTKFGFLITPYNLDSGLDNLKIVIVLLSLKPHL